MFTEPLFELRDYAGTTYIPLSKIIAFTGAKNNYTYIVIGGYKEPVLQSHCIGFHYKRVEQTGLFFKINRSTVININHVVRLEALTVYLTNNECFDISHKAHDLLKKLIPSL